jgi:hypothetical protein
VTKTIAANPDWLVHGYRAARLRFDATRDAPNAEERFLPLFEALNWIAAITHPDAPRSLVRAGKSPTDDDTVLGLRFIRDRVRHQWAEAIEACEVSNPMVTTAVRGQSRILMPPTRVEWF